MKFSILVPVGTTVYFNRFNIVPVQSNLDPFLFTSECFLSTLNQLFPHPCFGPIQRCEIFRIASGQETILRNIFYFNNIPWYTSSGLDPCLYPVPVRLVCVLRHVNFLLSLSIGHLYPSYFTSKTSSNLLRSIYLVYTLLYHQLTVLLLRTSHVYFLYLWVHPLLVYFRLYSPISVVGFSPPHSIGICLL